MSWWETDTYKVDAIVPKEFLKAAGPSGVACVRAYDDGKTAPGWGMKPDKNGFTFMDNYQAGRFDPQIAKIGMLSGRWSFAFVMRSMSLVCIDIDGKNGGMENVGKLGLLPETLAETSRSGNGYHLFYKVSDDVWNDKLGFAMFNDRIGIVPGVDVRALGCVYHVKQQRWNDRPIAELPPTLKASLQAKQAQVDDDVKVITALLDSGDRDEILVMQHTLVQDLKKPIPQGRRNTTLFAIGTQMKIADVKDWDELLYLRGRQVGLDKREADKIVENVKKYGGTP